MKSKISPTSALSEEIFYDEWLHLDLHPLWAYEGEVMARGVDHWDGCYLSAWLVLKGEAETVCDDGVRCRARQGEWLIPRPARRTQSFSKGCWLLSVAFKANWPTGQQLFKTGLPVCLNAEAHPALRRAANRLVQSVNRAFPDKPNWNIWNQRVSFSAFLRIESMLPRWVDAFTNALISTGLLPTRLGAVDDRLLKALQLLKQHPIDQPFSKDDISKKVGLSAVQLNRILLRGTGQTLKSCFEARRFEYAREALSYSAMPIKEVGLNLGFVYPSQFSNWFEKKSGASPRTFRLKFAMQKIKPAS